ncbi:MAG: DUF1830 domain-containing protein [Leptolyngbya sp. SIO1D8]|nr:DUF1830 domain-containing protein [Leptolyngbya sp. SIO1D8]
MTTLKSPHKILCRYTNHTSKFQVIRITNISHWFFERTVIPWETVIFETFREAQLEIHTGIMMSAILSDIIPCTQLTQPYDMSIKQSQLMRKTA